MNQYTFEDFKEIILRLRSEGGCPWDREQTHESLKHCLVEEAYEVAEGVDHFSDTGDYRNLREELGDVLLQVVMQAQIAEEEGIFTLYDVIDEVAVKMVRRHPHVFGDIELSDSGEVVAKWEEIKKKEKEGRGEEGGFSGIPKAFPSLIRASKVLKKAEDLYGIELGTVEAASGVRESIKVLESCCKEKQRTWEEEQEIEQAAGKLLFSATAMVRKLGKDAEEMLEKQVRSFISQAEK